jgi:polysaccharide biosynthesis/export protein
MRLLIITLAVLASSIFVAPAQPQAPARQQEEARSQDAYRINPGDLLEISVWGEEDLQREVRVRPDGALSFPLAGEIVARGRTPDEVRQEVESRLSRYIPDSVTTVTVTEPAGNQIFVIGQVLKPGAFVMNPALDVVQALAMAGGMTPYADLKNIVILRRQGTQQAALNFDYTEVSTGRALNQNVVLRSGDVVVVR